MPVRCGNRAHDQEVARQHYHHSADEVRRCYEGAPGRLYSLEEEAAFAECEHGMSASLCAGPQHYPADDPNSFYEHASTSELMVATAADYHRRGENCPFDCGRCPGNIAAEEAERRLHEEEERLLAEEEAKQKAQEANAQLDHPLYDGVYTIETADVSGSSHRTFRLKTQAKDADFAPGNQIIEYLSGPDNDSDYTGFGFVDRNALGYFVRVWKRYKDNVALQRDAETLLSDPDGALSSAQCFACHRTLTVPASVNQGYGPECIKKRAA